MKRENNLVIFAHIAEIAAEECRKWQAELALESQNEFTELRDDQND